MNRKSENIKIKLEPEVIICHNDDDVELAFDPFENNDVDFDIKKEVEDEDINFDPTDVKSHVRIVEIKRRDSSDSDHDDFRNTDDFGDYGNFGDFSSDDEKPPLLPNEDIFTNKIDSKTGSNTVECEPKTEPSGKSTKSEIDPSTGKKKKGRPKCKDEHKCSICGKVYAYASALKAHERTHFKDRGYNCPVCEKSFTRSDHCKQHMNIVHKGQVIGGILRMPTFEKNCDICKKVFYHPGNLNKHLILHTGERNHKCHICEKTFVLPQHLKSHIQIVHIKDKTFQCSICGKVFNHSANYRKHMRIHEGIKPIKCEYESCDKAFGQMSNYQNHLRVHANDRPFKCDDCGHGFTQLNALILHQRTHSGDKPFICDICDRSFRLKSQLKSHMEKHTTEKVHECLECGKKFTHQYLLRVHQRSIHKTGPQFKCDTCEKVFQFNHQLVKHIRTHTGEKPFPCTMDGCDASFATAVQRSRHFRSRHEEVKEVKDFVCSECGRLFHDKRLLSNHIKIHQGIRPYKCEYCPKAYITKSDCKKHERIHTGVKPYKCDLCGREFTFSNSYRIHMRNHLGEKPFSCPLCSKTFSCSSDRGKHVRSHRV